MPTTSTKPTEFEELMSELASGSEDAAWKIADLYTPYIIRIVRNKLPPNMRLRVDSQDFVQAVWASVLLHRTYLATFDSPERLAGFLAAIAKHKVVDGCRTLETQARDLRREEPLVKLENTERDTENRRPGVPVVSALAGGEPTPSTVVSLKERWQTIMKEASPRDRRIVKLRIEGLTYKEISEQTAVTNITVRRVLGRLIGKLKE